jgi:hypothetical protein
MKPGITLATVMVFAEALFFVGRAQACDDLSVMSGSSCAQWAPITGDPAQDECTVAKLDRLRLEREYDPARMRTIADAPLPPRNAILDQLKEASDRVTRDCAQADSE